MMTNNMYGQLDDTNMGSILGSQIDKLQNDANMDYLLFKYNPYELIASKIFWYDSPNREYTHEFVGIDKYRHRYYKNKIIKTICAYEPFYPENYYNINELLHGSISNKYTPIVKQYNNHPVTVLNLSSYCNCGGLEAIINYRESNSECYLNDTYINLPIGARLNCMNENNIRMTPNNIFNMYHKLDSTYNITLESSLINDLKLDTLNMESNKDSQNVTLKYANQIDIVIIDYMYNLYNLHNLHNSEVSMDEYNRDILEKLMGFANIIQKSGGILIMKIMIFPDSISDLLEILSQTYRIQIIKPQISNILNNECYIVCESYTNPHFQNSINPRNIPQTAAPNNRNTNGNTNGDIKGDIGGTISIINMIKEHNKRVLMERESVLKCIKMNKPVDYRKNMLLNIQYANEYNLIVSPNYTLNVNNIDEVYNMNDNDQMKEYVLGANDRDTNDDIYNLDILLDPNYNYMANDELKFKYTKLYLIKLSLNKYKRFIDTKEQYFDNNWGIVTNDIDLYRPLKNILKSKYNAESVTNAWTKIYEILVRYQLLENIINTSDISDISDIAKIRSFHLCELPGSFIFSFNHYIKTKFNNIDIEYNWQAQSLNPQNMQNITKYPSLLKDDLTLIKKFPDRWVFGDDNNNGDITSEINIRSYQRDIVNIDIITSDCGLKMSNKDYNEQELKLSKLNFGQILAILAVLPKNKSAVLKTFIPFCETITISLLWLLYNTFNKVIITKPITSHPSSSEVYILCDGYRGVASEVISGGISSKTIDKLFVILNNFDCDRSIFPRCSIPEGFIDDIHKCSTYFVESQIKSIMRSLYYYDNPKEINLVKNTRNDKCYAWIRKHNISPIENKLRMAK